MVANYNFEIITVACPTMIKITVQFIAFVDFDDVRSITRCEDMPERADMPELVDMPHLPLLARMAYQTRICFLVNYYDIMNTTYYLAQMHIHI